MLADGRVAYRLRKPRNNGATHLGMTPVERLAKIAALVPPPKRPLLRLSGVLGPGSSWRASVVPGGARVAQPAHAGSGAAAQSGGGEDKAKLARADGVAAKSGGEEKPAQGSGSARSSLGNGVVPPQGARIDGASLLKRIFLEDVLACPCGGRRRIVCEVQDRDAVVAILRHRGLPTEAPPIARARDPAEMAFGFA
jgi:hypothetical protein